MYIWQSLRRGVQQTEVSGENKNFQSLFFLLFFMGSNQTTLDKQIFASNNLQQGIEEGLPHI